MADRDPIHGFAAIAEQMVIDLEHELLAAPPERREVIANDIAGYRKLHLQIRQVISDTYCGATLH
jgi:hypothetical protein